MKKKLWRSSVSGAFLVFSLKKPLKFSLSGTLALGIVQVLSKWNKQGFSVELKKCQLIIETF